MGEPEPLDLELLQQGDEHEIRRAIRELDLKAIAVSTVARMIQANYGGDVERLALAGITRLFTRAIHNVNRIEHVQGMLRRAARYVVLDFLGDRFQQLVDAPGQLEFMAVENDEHPIAFLRDVLAEGLRMENFDLNQLPQLLIEVCELEPLEEALLVEHILGGLTQQDFARKYGIPFGGIGGRKDRLLAKIRRMLSAKCPALQERLRRIERPEPITTRTRRPKQKSKSKRTSNSKRRTKRRI